MILSWKAWIAIAVASVAWFVFMAPLSGLPGHFDPKSVEYGKGPQVGEEYRCTNDDYYVPCTRDEYWYQFFNPVIIIVNVILFSFFGIIVYFSLYGVEQLFLLRKPLSKNSLT